MGTPESWRRAEELPGAGTNYVILLSTVQLSAALLTLVSVKEDPRRGCPIVQDPLEST